MGEMYGGAAESCVSPYLPAPNGDHEVKHLHTVFAGQIVGIRELADQI
jgi:hypothetical protein